MGHLRSIPEQPFAGIAEAHQSCVAYILRAVRLGLFTEAEGDLLISRVCALSAGLAGQS